MPRRDAARMLSRSRGSRPAPADRNRRLAIRGKPQIIWVFLSPLEPCLVPINPQPQIVFIPGGYLARPQPPSRPTFKSQEHLHIAAEPPPRHENGNVCRHLLAPQSRHKTRDVISMRPDIPQ